MLNPNFGAVNGTLKGLGVNTEALTWTASPKLALLSVIAVFDQIFILTEGGPGFATETVSLYIYRTAFRFGDFGYAAAMSFVLLVLTNTISVLYIRLLQRQEAT
jgi:ABC-type sugar transport system permease subunit